MTGMGRPKHLQPWPRWALPAVLAYLVGGAILADYFSRG